LRQAYDYWQDQPGTYRAGGSQLLHENNRRDEPPQQSQCRTQSHIKCGFDRPARFSTNALGVKIVFAFEVKTKEPVANQCDRAKPSKRSLKNGSACNSIGVPCLYSRHRSNKQSFESRSNNRAALGFRHLLGEQYRHIILNSLKRGGTCYSTDTRNGLFVMLTHRVHMQTPPTDSTPERNAPCSISGCDSCFNLRAEPGHHTYRGQGFLAL
jgi:hypothetical protein